jgi:hypothetical protein
MKSRTQAQNTYPSHCAIQPSGNGGGAKDGPSCPGLYYLLSAGIPSYRRALEGYARCGAGHGSYRILLSRSCAFLLMISILVREEKWRTDRAHEIARVLCFGRTRRCQKRAEDSTASSEPPLRNSTLSHSPWHLPPESILS